jgi:hypothetical protein
MTDRELPPLLPCPACQCTAAPELDQWVDGERQERGAKPMFTLNCSNTYCQFMAEGASTVEAVRDNWNNALARNAAGLAARAPMTRVQALALLTKHCTISTYDGDVYSEKAVDAILEASRGLAKEQVLALVPKHELVSDDSQSSWNSCRAAMIANIEAAYKEAGK